MSKLTISQALKAKKKLINKINQLKTKIQHNNRYIKGDSSSLDYDVKELLIQLETSSAELVNLKAAIQRANVPVLEKIYRLSELKDLITLYRMIPTSKGRERATYRAAEAAPVEWAVQVDQLTVDKKLAEIENEIELVQEHLDKFNHTTYLDI